MGNNNLPGGINEVGNDQGLTDQGMMGVNYNNYLTQ